MPVLGGSGGQVSGYTLNDLYLVQQTVGSTAWWDGVSAEDDNNVAFFTSHLPNWGGGSITNASTSYQTIVNITGSGNFLWACTGVSNTAKTPTFRITIDGVSRELTCTTQEVNSRVWVLAHAYSSYESTVNLAAVMRTVPNWKFAASTVAPHTWPRPTVVPGPSSGKYTGVRFETDCKVEIKLASGGYDLTSAHEYNGAAVLLD